MTADTTNALRALDEWAVKWVAPLPADARAEFIRLTAALATAQPEAKPEGVDDLRDAAVSLLLGARPYSDVTSIVPNARLKTLAQAARLTRQAQGGGEESA